jgi:hypothetical protein
MQGEAGRELSGLFRPTPTPAARASLELRAT